MLDWCEGSSDYIPNQERWNINSTRAVQQYASTWKYTQTDTFLTDDKHPEDGFFAISYAYYALLTFAVTSIVAFITSALTEKEKLTDPTLIASWLRDGYFN